MEDPQVVRDFIRSFEWKMLHADNETVAWIMGVNIAVFATIIAIGKIYEYFTVDRTD